MVQEYLEGDTLREPLKKGALPLARALDLATEIAEALAAAHAAGIVHRDLKPANLFVTQEGHAKVLDFGLAKLVEPELAGGTAESRLSGSPTVLGTVAGQVMGTAGYMAPEQVAGEEIDHRADIFAFGCVLYEMASGKQAFTAGSVLDTLHAIAHDDPQPLAEINPALPAELHRILKKCLAKEPGDRYQGAGELATDLRSLAGEVEAGTAAPLGSSLGGPHTGSGLRRPIPIGLSAAAMVVVALVAFVAGWVFMQPPDPDSGLVQRFLIDAGLPSGSLIGAGGSVLMSPDGRHMVFRASPPGLSVRLYLRPMNAVGATEIPGTEEAAWPFFSSDSGSLGFFARGAVWKIPLAGGDPFKLADLPGSGRGVGGSWADDGTIVFSTWEALWRVPAVGGAPDLFAEVDPEESRLLVLPRALPGARHALVHQVLAAGGTRAVVVSLETGEIESVVAENGGDPRYSPTGHVIYTRGASIDAVPFDLGRLEVLGPAVPVLQDSRIFPNGAGAFGVSDTGSLVYEPGLDVDGVRRSLVWVDRQGNQTVVDEREEDFRAPRLSPDGSRIAVEIFAPGAPAAIYIYGIGTGTWERLTDADICTAPLWTVDSTRVFFNCDSESAGALGNIYARPADFSAGRSEAFLDTDGGAYPISWSGDDKLLTHEMIEGVQGRRRILVLPLGEDSTPYSLLDDSGQFNQRNPMISPSGNWMAYVESQSGQDEIYVRSFPDPSRRYAVSRDGGVSPMWGRDDRELFYRGPEGMMLAHVDFETEPQVQVEREVLFQDDRFYIMGNAARTMYDYDRENDRFLMAEAGRAQQFHPVVVLNWFEELKRRVPTGR